MNTNLYLNANAVAVIPAAFSAVVSANAFEAAQVKPRTHRTGLVLIGMTDAPSGQDRHPRGIPL